MASSGVQARGSDQQDFWSGKVLPEAILLFTLAWKWPFNLSNYIFSRSSLQITSLSLKPYLYLFPKGFCLEVWKIVLIIFGSQKEFTAGWINKQLLWLDSWKVVHLFNQQFLSFHNFFESEYFFNPRRTWRITSGVVRRNFSMSSTELKFTNSNSELKNSKERLATFREKLKKEFD